MGTISHLPRRDRPQPARLASEPEAEAALDMLVASWKDRPHDLAQRRESLKLSGLTAISLSADTGGLDCSATLLALVVRRIETVDPDAAEALQRHFVLIDLFREEKDERFYSRLAEQSLAGDLMMAGTDPALGRLGIRHEDFHATASGELLLPQSALLADWLWLPSLNDAAGHLIDGFALVPVRAAIFETRSDSNGYYQLVARFRNAPVAHGLWGQHRPGPRTALALDHLLEAARESVRLEVSGEGAISRAALRLSLARKALLSMVNEAAQALDNAQVNPTAAGLDRAALLCREAALFAADLTGREARFEQLAEMG